MPFEPDFMRDLDRFHADLAAVTTPADWQRFRFRWFADQPWPRRAGEEAVDGPLAPLIQAGRTYQRAPLPDDLTPEARYQYFAALAHGFSALFPPEERPGAPGVPVRWSCPACQLLSDQPGEPDCPECGRPLIAMRHAPPPR
jgi:hypothetical protein